MTNDAFEKKLTEVAKKQSPNPGDDGFEKKLNQIAKRQSTTRR